MGEGIESFFRKNGLKFVSEFMSTSLLLLLGCMGCLPIYPTPPSHLQSVLGFGFTVMFNIQIFGHISGGFMNPALTVSGVIMGHFTPLVGLGYILSECAGAVFGFGLLTYMTPYETLALNQTSIGFCNTMIHPEVSSLQALAIEGLGTGMLVLLTCALLFDPVNKKFHDGITIKFGLTIIGLALVVGGMTGCSLNPARSLAPAIWNNYWTNQWIYWLGPLAGSIICSYIYKFLLHSGIKKEEALNPAEELPLNEQTKHSNA